MTVRLDKQTKERITFLAEKYNKDRDELEGRVRTITEEIKDGNPDRGMNTCVALARRQLIIELRSTRRRRSTPSGDKYLGVVFGADRLRDRIADYREVCERVVKKLRPNKPHDDKLTGYKVMMDENEQLLDMRKQIKGRDNWGYGKPLPQHDYHRVVFGVASKGDDAPNWFIAHMYGDHAAEINHRQLFATVEFTASSKGNTGDHGEDILVMKNLPTPSTELGLGMGDIVDYCGNLDVGTHTRKIELGDIIEFIEEHWDGEWSTTEFLVEADVDGIWPNDDGGGRVYLIDESLEFLDDELDTIMGWFKPEIGLTFAEGSRIVLCCNAFRKKEWDRDLQQETEEWGDPQINIIGWYALPEFLVPRLDAGDTMDELEDAEEEE